MKKNFYELTYLVNAVLEEPQMRAEVDAVTNYIKENGGEFDEINEWGIRQLAYEIDGKKSAYYVNCYFTAPGQLIVGLERQLQIMENVMRFLFLKYDNKMLRHRELQKKGEVPNVLAVEIEESEEN